VCEGTKNTKVGCKIAGSSEESTNKHNKTEKKIQGPAKNAEDEAIQTMNHQTKAKFSAMIHFTTLKLIKVGW
jgi:hypothetical protein